MMLIRILFLALGLISSSGVWSFTCYYTLVKDSCWLKYNVSVDVIDPLQAKTVLTINVPAGTPWAREVFNCHPAQNFMYVARFSPVFWKTDAGKTYNAVRQWSLPGVIHPGDTAWTLSICYPKDFAQVPLPPEADNNCACDFSVIPQIVPK